MSLEIKVKYFSENVPKLKLIKQGDWIDLYAAETVIMKPFVYTLIPLGVAIQLPEGYEGWLAPRSSTFKHYGVIQANSFGVIDNSYCGDDDQWFFPAICFEPTKIPLGAKICQFRIVKTMNKMLVIKEVDRLNNKNRGGFGSTGK